MRAHLGDYERLEGRLNTALSAALVPLFLSRGMEQAKKALTVCEGSRNRLNGLFGVVFLPHPGPPD